MVKKIPNSGLMMGRNGRKRKHLMKQLNGQGPQLQKKKERGFAKHEKRRALRTVIVPSELMITGGKRKNKKLLVAAIIVDHQIKMEAEAASSEAATNKQENSMKLLM
mmetsp:Transcript_45431/g.91661  ORF Transcript_45431/g.91661 Transcript_45431/m.91661 type:complete len:107 (+) Transcript_45431:37-357(+)